MPKTFTIIAHRGDSSSAPENTLEAFDVALSHGCFHIETDCQLSADGVPVVLHDEMLGRVNTGSGPVAAATLQELQQLDAGSWFSPQFTNARIPTLEFMLQRYRDRIHLHLELKSQQPQLPAAVAAVVLRQLSELHTWSAAPAGPEQPTQSAHISTSDTVAEHTACDSIDDNSVGTVPGLTITSFHLQQLLASRQLLPQVPHGWLIQEVTPDIIHTAQQAGLRMVCPRANALTADVVQALKMQGFVVRAWGVKTIELLHHVVACGADGATVNWPAEAAAALAQQTAMAEANSPKICMQSVEPLRDA